VPVFADLAGRRATGRSPHLASCVSAGLIFRPAVPGKAHPAFPGRRTQTRHSLADRTGWHPPDMDRGNWLIQHHRPRLFRLSDPASARLFRQASPAGKDGTGLSRTGLWADRPFGTPKPTLGFHAAPGSLLVRRAGRGTEGQARNRTCSWCFSGVVFSPRRPGKGRSQGGLSACIRIRYRQGLPTGIGGCGWNPSLRPDLYCP
jgi:hypothetical protein